jgi:hypothetical protein
MNDDWVPTIVESLFPGRRTAISDPADEIASARQRVRKQIVLILRNPEVEGVDFG